MCRNVFLSIPCCEHIFFFLYSLSNKCQINCAISSFVNNSDVYNPLSDFTLHFIAFNVKKKKKAPLQLNLKVFIFV